MRDPVEIHKLLYDGVWVPGSTLPSPLWRATGPLFGISYGRTTRPSGLEEACGSWMLGSERVSQREPLAGSSGAPDGHRAGLLSGDAGRPRALVPKARSGRMRFHLADMREVPFRSGSFDFVCSSAALESLPDAQEAFVEFCRVLRPRGGRALIIPTRGPLWASPSSCCCETERMPGPLGSKHAGGGLRSSAEAALLLVLPSRELVGDDLAGGKGAHGPGVLGAD